MFLKLKEDLSCTLLNWETRASLQEHELIFFFVFSTLFILLKHSSAIKNSLRGEKSWKTFISMAYSATEYLKIRICEASQFCVCLCFGVHRTARITLWETATGCSGGREKKDLSIILDALPYKCELKTLWASFCLWGICSTGAETVFRGIWKSALPKVVLEWTYIIQIPTFAVSEVNSIVESQSSGSTE